MWIWLLAILIIAGTWIAGTILGWPLWLEILITVFAVLLVVGWLVGGRVRAALKSRALERDLLRQAEEQARNARPDRRAEIMELQAQMQRGLAAMKQSRMTGGASALYRLPWYMIVGPPGAGKTTALRQSGLAFPFLDPRSGGGVRGIGGTRNCDWWFTNDAILLDTAGRYATEADDYDEWTAFLDTLRRYRSRKPVNGVIVAVSVTDLMEAREDQIDGMAKRLRSRIDEIATRLQMICPVYVMFTKVDLVAGFVEFWGDLRKSERGMIWGVTFPLAGAERRDPAQAFEPEFDLLMEKVHARALRRVGAERQIELRPRIYQFPLELASLKQPLIDFVGALLQPNNFRETPVLRGVYLTSGTQEGRPIDRVIGQMMSAFNMAAPMMPQMPQYQQTSESKSYFVTELFRRVVFPDQHIAAMTPAEARRQLLNRLAFSIAALVVAVGLVMPSLYTFGRNASLESESKELAKRANRIDWSDTSPPMAKVHALDELHEKIDTLDDWHEHGAPLGMGWGMYAGNTLLPALRSVYAASLTRAFVTPTKAQLEHELAPAAGQTRSSIEQYGVYFLRLKTYLSMTDPQHLQGEDGDKEAATLTEAWARVLGVTSPADKAALKVHVASYVNMVARSLIPPWTPDMALVTRVRAVLLQTSRLDRDYSSLVHEANENVASISHGTIFRGSTFAEYVSTKSTPEVMVQGAFTKVGWESYIRDALEDESRAKKLARDRWVMGESAEKGEQEIKAELKQLEQRYFTEYTGAWAAFVKDIDFRKPDSDDAALKELSSASESPWPMLMLLQMLAENTRLQPSPESPLAGAAANRLADLAASAQAKAQNVKEQALGDAAVGPKVPTLMQRPKRWVSPVEDAFAPMVTFGVPLDMMDAGNATGLSHYLEEIVSKLVGVLTDLKDSPVKPTQKVVATAYETAHRATNELVESTQTTFTKPLFGPLLLAPVTK
jgi:type VI secretion system protein ImpL